MISNNLPHTYIDSDRKFYTFFLNFEVPSSIEGKTFKGFHFFCFDQRGYCWFHMYNTTRQAVNAFANGIFLERPAWEAEDTQASYEYLERDMWLPNASIDIAYALETVREATGLDLILLYRASEEKKEETS